MGCSLDRNALGMAVATVAVAAAVAGVAAVAHLGTELPTPCACGPSSLLACLHVSLEWLSLRNRHSGPPQAGSPAVLLSWKAQLQVLI